MSKWVIAGFLVLALSAIVIGVVLATSGPAGGSTGTGIELDIDAPKSKTKQKGGKR